MPLRTKPFDPADYLFDEEDMALYLADARAFGPEVLSEAAEVVARARARARMTGPDPNSTAARR